MSAQDCSSSVVFSKGSAQGVPAVEEATFSFWGGTGEEVVWVQHLRTLGVICSITLGFGRLPYGKPMNSSERSPVGSHHLPKCQTLPGDGLLHNFISCDSQEHLWWLWVWYGKTASVSVLPLGLPQQFWGAIQSLGLLSVCSHSLGGRVRTALPALLFPG